MVFSFIGSGNVASFFARYFKSQGFLINQVYSKKLLHAQNLGSLVDAESIDQLDQLNANADVYIISVTDDVLPLIVKQLSLKNKLVLHTSGFTSINILASVTDRFGVLWPMKMIRDVTPINDTIGVCIFGNSVEVTESISNILHQFPWSITIADDKKRRKMHFLATFTANFSNHLYHLAYEYCQMEDIPFQSLYNIIEQTAVSIQKDRPSLLQAGPSYRGDDGVVKAHLDLLKDHYELIQFYQLFSTSIDTTYRNKK